MLNAATARLRALFFPGTVREEIDEELRSHLNQEEERQVALGANLQEAGYAARRAVGNVTLHREEARDAYGWRWWDELRHDVWYAARQIKRAPALTTAIVLLLAIGIGPNAALIAGIDALMTRPWPGAQAADELFQLSFKTRQGFPMSLSADELFAFQQRQHVFAGVAGSWGTLVALDMRGVPSEVGAELVTGSYFTVLRLRMALGRGIPPGDDRGYDPQPVVVVSYRFWQSQLGGSAAAVGSVVRVNGIPVTIVGVMPKGFPGPELWLPYSARRMLSLSAEEGPERDISRVLQTIQVRQWNGIAARLAHGVPVAQARAASTVIAAAIHSTADRQDLIGSSALSSSNGGGVSDALKAVGPLPAVSILILLIACGNASILLLGRAVTRRREVAVRLSLGASRSRVVRQLLTESALVALLAAAVGLLLLVWTSRLLWVRLPMIPVDLTPSWSAIATTAVFATLVGMLSGLTPALHATSVGVGDALKDGVAGPDVRRARLQRGLVVAEVALSMILVCGTALFVHAFQGLMSVEGFAASPRVLLSDVDLFAAHYSAARADAFFDRARERIGALPGVESVGFVNAVLLRSVFMGGRAPGVPTATDAPTGVARAGLAQINLVDPGYFDAMQHPLRLGRDMARSDAVGAPRVAIISADIADSLWPRVSPIGKSMTVVQFHSFVGGAHPDTIRATVIGVAGSARREEILDMGTDMQGRQERHSNEATVYLSRRQWPDSGRVTIVVQCSRVDPAIAIAIERELRALDARLPFTSVVNAVEYQEAPHQTAYTLIRGIALMGALALLLACVGIYAVIAFGVAQRTREIGIRLALGARGDQVVAQFFRAGMGLSVIGFSIGLPLTVMIMKVTVAGALGTRMLAPLAVASIVAVLLAVAAIASWLPARRAAAVDPLIALRSE